MNFYNYKLLDNMLLKYGIIITCFFSSLIRWSIIINVMECVAG